jgi:molybdopterin synthase sulfur carrier subunit
MSIVVSRTGKRISRFYSHLRDSIGLKSKMGFDLNDSATISHLLSKLSNNSKIKQHLLDDNDKLKSGTTLLKNGREIRFMEGFETILESGDEVSIFPLVAGGYPTFLEIELFLVQDDLDSDYSDKIHV